MTSFTAGNPILKFGRWVNITHQTSSGAKQLKLSANEVVDGIDNMSDIVAFVLVAFVLHTSAVSETSEEENLSFKLDKFNKEYTFMMWTLQTLEWAYAVNMTEENAKSKERFEMIYSEWIRGWKSWAKSITYYDKNSTDGRIILMMSNGVVFSSPEMAKKASALRSKMASIYANGKVSFENKKIKAQGEEEVGHAMSNAEDPETLAKMWREWRRNVGNKIKPLFLELASLFNVAAKENGYHDIGEVWRSELSMKNVVHVATSIWWEVADLYRHIHAFVRRRLIGIYGSNLIDEKGPIPIHLLGSLWGDNWESISDIALPFPNVKLPDLTSCMLQRNMSVGDMARLSESFYTSIGMYPMTPSFWEKSMFVRPKDNRSVDCHGSAFDFGVDDDFRIKVCSTVCEKDLKTLVHEMGHVEYFMAYRSQPMIFRSGANSAFHEAIGETMVYSALNPSCLKLVGLWEEKKLKGEQQLNLLMKHALSKIVFLPWSLLIDLWRYEVFEGKLTPENMTKRWWEMRKYYQGVAPPSPEDEKEFDPGSKYHVANNIPYIRYYFSRFLEHQMHEALCSSDGRKHHVLHLCCLYGSLQAGDKLRQGLSLGSSKPWQEVLKVIAGSETLMATPLLRYYRPLYDWLRDENARNRETVGWTL